MLLLVQVVPGGRVIWRSAALCPPYARIIREAGFEVIVCYDAMSECAWVLTKPLAMNISDQSCLPSSPSLHPFETLTCYCKCMIG